MHNYRTAIPFLGLFAAALAAGACGDDTTTTTTGGGGTGGDGGTASGTQSGTDGGGGTGGDGAMGGSGGTGAMGGGGGMPNCTPDTGADACPGEQYTLMNGDAFCLAGDTGTATDDYQFPNCVDDPGGPERVYQFDIPNAGSLKINGDAATDSDINVGMYFTTTPLATPAPDACTNIDINNSALKCAAWATASKTELITLDVTEPTTLFLFVDSEGNETGEYEINVEFDEALCGDGVLNAGEECDDGNMNDGDDCSNSCQFQLVTVFDTCPGEPFTVFPGTTFIPGSTVPYTHTQQPVPIVVGDLDVTGLSYPADVQGDDLSINLDGTTLSYVVAGNPADASALVAELNANFAGVNFSINSGGNLIVMSNNTAGDSFLQVLGGTLVTDFDAGATPLNGACSFVPTGGKDRVYQLTAAQSGLLTVTVGLEAQSTAVSCDAGPAADTCWDYVLYAYGPSVASCGDAPQQVACSDENSLNPEEISMEVQTGETYFVVVDGYFTPDFGTYELVVDLQQ